MAQAGYNPLEMARFFEKLAAEGGARGPAFLSSHPDPGMPLAESERVELNRLREESKHDKATIAELQMQIEFAKKVATWFAKGKQ